MSEWQDLNDSTRSTWETNAAHWDGFMGDEGNRFHLDLVRPATERLLDIRPGQRVLDVACGNGNFSRRLAELGAEVLGIDFSPTLIDHARARSGGCGENPHYQVVDATDYAALVSLGAADFDAAVANMALMDISNLRPLTAALPGLLRPGAAFVFSVSHPCFQTPGGRRIYEEQDVDGQPVTQSFVQVGQYITPKSHAGMAIPNEPVPSRYFHRPLSTMLQMFFEQGFVLDGMHEPVFERDSQGLGFQWTDVPPVMVCRVRTTTPPH